MSKSNQQHQTALVKRERIIKIGDFNFEIFDNFSNLGSKITTDNSYDDEAHTRLLAANRAYFNLQDKTSHHMVKALTVQNNDHANPQNILSKNFWSPWMDDSVAFRRYVNDEIYKQ